MNGYADGGARYYVEIKKGKLVKRILSNNSFIKAETSYIAGKITNIIKTIENKYGFKFYDGWNKVMESTKFFSLPNL